MYEHLILFDGECPLCHKAVRHILEIDVDRRFAFAPLGGQTASQLLSGPQKPLAHAQSLVLIEQYQSTDREFYIRSKAIFRIYWLIGHGWQPLGLLSFLPCFLTDFLYRKVVIHRHQFKLKIAQDPFPEGSLLP